MIRGKYAYYVVQAANYKLSQWQLCCVIVVLMQIAQTIYGIQTFSLDEAFYRITPYEENYILPMHYILTRVNMDARHSIPLPVPEMSDGLWDRVKQRKSMADYDNLKRQSAMIKQRYPYITAKEVAFQTSFKVPLAFIQTTQTQFYFGYTARSWWQCYTGISAFFREIEQKADFFIEQPFFMSPACKSYSGLHFDKLKFGFLHHSNGEGLAFERSCNRVYVALFMKWFAGPNKWGLVLKRWHFLETPDKQIYNPDIEAYVGNNEITVNFEGQWLQWTVRKQAHSIQCLVNFPFSSSLRGLIYYFNGNGSTIGLYKTPCHSVGIGLQAKH